MKRYMCSLVMGVVGLVGSAQAALVTVTVEPSAPAGTVLDNYYYNEGITLGIQQGGSTLTSDGHVYSYQVGADAAKHAGKMVFAWLAADYPATVPNLDETWTGWKTSLKVVFSKPVNWVAIDVLRDDLRDSAEMEAFGGLLSLGKVVTSNVGWVADTQTLQFTALPGQFITSILVSGTYQYDWDLQQCLGVQAVLLNNLRYEVEAPEPASILCLLGGALGIVGWGWSRRRTA